jgi:hypothetical protein
MKVLNCTHGTDIKILENIYLKSDEKWKKKSVRCGPYVGGWGQKNGKIKDIY